MEPLRIIITGEHEDLAARCPTRLVRDGRPLQWVELPVLRFEKLPVDPAVIDELVKKPVDWILFTSTRSVRFWAETLMEKGVDFPVETQVACIGEHTAADGGSGWVYGRFLSHRARLREVSRGV